MLLIDPVVGAIFGFHFSVGDDVMKVDALRITFLAAKTSESRFNAPPPFIEGFFSVPDAIDRLLTVVDVEPATVLFVLGLPDFRIFIGHLFWYY